MAHNQVKNGQREQWTGQYGFILAAVGSAIGLGNIWRFPGIAYANGGGAFILPYVIALLTAGIPILLLDYVLGHRYRGSAPAVFRRISRKFEALGWFQVMICFVIMAYYAVILAWAVRFVFFSVNEAWGDDTQSFFLVDFLKVGDAGFSTDFVGGIFWPLIFVWLAAAVVIALGVAGGLERLNKVFIPLLVVIFTILVVRALFLPGAADGLNALFTPNWGALLKFEVWIAAYSQIFFSLSIAFGIMITYSSYLSKKSDVAATGFVTAFANSSFELLAGIGVFATLGFMAHQEGVGVGELEGLTGPILSFVTFPAVISMMPGGPIFGVIFFASLTIAGFTSLISLLQVVSAAIQEKFGKTRRVAALFSVGITGVLSVLFFSTTNGLNALDVVDKYINELGIVLSAIIMTLALSYYFKKLPIFRHHLNHYSSLHVGKWWYVAVSVISPIVLTVTFVLTVISLITDGYGGYALGFLGQYGWGMMLIVAAATLVLTVLPWKTDVDSFNPVDYHEDEATPAEYAHLGTTTPAKEA